MGQIKPLKYQVTKWLLGVTATPKKYCYTTILNMLSHGEPFFSVAPSQKLRVPPPDKSHFNHCTKVKKKNCNIYLLARINCSPQD